MAGSRKKGKRLVTFWLDKDELAEIDRVARSRGVPRTFLIENLIRAAVGLPPLSEPSPNTRKDYLQMPGQASSKKI